MSTNAVPPTDARVRSDPAAVAGPGAVYLVGEQRVAVVPVEQAAAMVGVAEMVVDRAERLGQADRLTNLAEFTERLREAMATAGSSAVRLDVDEGESQVATSILMQTRARAALAESARIKHVCRTCGSTSLTNPEYDKVAKRNRTVDTISRSVGFTMTGNPFLLLNAFVGLVRLDPDYTCRSCKGMTEDAAPIVFCPKCKAQCDKVLLSTCKKCGYSFVAGVDIADLWQPADRVAAPAPAGRKLTELELEQDPSALVFLPDGDRLLVASRDRTVQLWDLSEGAPRRVWVVTPPAGLADTKEPIVAASPDGTLVAVAKQCANSVRLLRTRDGDEVGCVEWALTDKGGLVYGLAFLPDGSAYAVAGSQIELRDVAGRCLAEWNVGALNAAGRVAVTPDGAYLVAAGGAMSFSQLWIYALAGGDRLAKVAMHGGVNALASGPAPGRVAAAVRSVARLIEVPSGRTIAEFAVDAEATAVAFSPDGAHLAVASKDRSARVFDLARGTEIARISRPAEVTAVAFAPDGRLAVGDAAKAVQFWSPPD